MKCYRFVLSVLIINVIILFLISCATEESSENTPIVIEKINFTQVTNRTPKESNFQKDIELFGILGNDNRLQDISTEWYVEYLDMDVYENILKKNNNGNDETDDSEINSNEQNNSFFIDVSKNPLNALLTIYSPGYYKITLHASNMIETIEKSIIIKSGDIELPDLFVKLNIPELTNAKSEYYKGKLYLEITNDNIKSDLIEIDASSMKDGWYDTDYKIDPFLSFSIKSGTHILKSDSLLIKSIEKTKTLEELDSITYSYNNKNESVSSYPIVIKNLEQGSLSISKKGSREWQKGNVYLGILSWSSNEDNKDIFSYAEKNLTPDNKSISINFNKSIYLTKIFAGSIGIKHIPNEYFVFFGPEGSLVEELDPFYTRPYDVLPYGHLIGKLKEDGNAFPIGSSYTHIQNNNLPIYVQDDNNNFILLEQQN